MLRIDNSYSYAYGTLSIRPGIIDLVQSPAPPIMNGVRLWYTWDDQPWIGPIDVRDEHFEHATAIPVTNGAMRVETIYLPMEFDYTPGTHRVAAQRPTHLVYDVIQDGPPMDPEPEPEPEPVCTKPPAPELDPLHAFHLEESVPDYCAPFAINLGGTFAFGWEKVPGAVKYNVEVTAVTGTPLLSATVDSNSSACKKEDTCMYSAIPPIAYSPGCGYSGYFVYVSAVNACGKESDPSLGALGYAGPYSDF
jgi:hypothetical protein